MLKDLSDSVLHTNTKAAAKREQAATLDLLEHLAEVDRRRLFAKMGRASLWEYIFKDLGYSRSQASERNAAAQLFKRVPEVKEGLESGALNLTNAAQIGAHVKHEGLDAVEARKIVLQAVSQPTREVERMLATLAPEPPKREHKRAMSETITRLSFDVDHEFMELVEQMKAVQKETGLKEILHVAMKEYVSRRTKKPKEKTQVVRAPELKSGRIRAKDLRRLRERSGNRCEFVSEMTVKRCESRARLEPDHIIPLAKGGTNEFENLRHYCRTHNIQAAIEEFGESHMSQFLRE